MFEKWKNRYDMGGATENHIYRLVVLGQLSETEYKTITGNDFAEQ